MDKRVLLPLVALACGLAVTVALIKLKQPPKQNDIVVLPTAVTYDTVTVAPLRLAVSSYGTAEPKHETLMVAEVSGRIVDISPSFERGRFVKKGELIAKIDDTDYQNMLIEAQANLASAKAGLQEEMAKGKVAEDEWKKIKNRQPTALSLRKPQLAQEEARVKAAQAAVQRAQNNLDRTRIMAPYDGLVDARHVSLGSFVNPGSQVGKVLSTGYVEIRLPIARKDMRFLGNRGVGAEVTLTTGHAADGTFQSWQASIVRDEQVLDEKNRMAYLVARVDDPYQVQQGESYTTKPLRFGTYLTASIKGVTLPAATAISQYLLKNNKVAVIGHDETLILKSVTVARLQDDIAIVDSGLETGDRIITSALSYAVEGIPLSLMESRTVNTGTTNKDGNSPSKEGRSDD